jgi:glycosyltransferase involved in cell wall biosynthesis
MRILLLNQCFHPDHVSTAQHLTDLALGLVEAGHEVTAVASSRGYDDPTKRFSTRETWRGITIHRIWTPGLGKKSKWRRFADFACFWLSATLILLRLPRFDVTVCLTSPPLISSLGTLIAALKGGAVVPWVMDLNPDEAVAAGWLRAGGLMERVLSGLQRWSFRRAARIMVLDRFMARRLEAKGVPSAALHIDPPWSYEGTVHHDPALRAAFRAEHGLTGKFVVMYSGNHSPCHPLDTALEAAEQLAADERIQFVFIGGGSEFPKVQKFAQSRSLTNILCLPYQPLEKLSASLYSADIHLVVMGDAFTGIVHPCKIYNILLLGLPFLAVCPAECHLTDLAAQIPDARYAQCVRRGDVAGFMEAISAAARTGNLPPAEEVRRVGAQFVGGVLRPRFIEAVETAVGAPPPD